MEVVLRSAQRHDSALLFEWINDRSLVTLSSAFHPVSEPEHQVWFERYMSMVSLDVLFMISLADKSTIGYCQLVNVSAVHRSAEVRIRIANTSNRNQGYGTAALQQLVIFALHDKNLHRLCLTVDERNYAAIRAYEKAGFSREGLMRDAAFLNGVYTNLVLMGLTSKEG